MIGGDSSHQSGIADLQRSDAVAGGDRPNPGCVGRHLGQHLEQNLFGVWMRRVIQPEHLTAPIVVTHDSGKTHHRAGRLAGHQSFVVGERNFAVSERGPQNPRHRLWSPPRS